MEEFNDDAIYQVENQNNFFVKTFFRMFLGLLGTALAAFYTYQSGLFLSLSFPALALIELVMVLVFSFAFKKLSPTVVTILFYGYAFLNGATFSVIFAVYELGSIFSAFLLTALLFGGLALYGYKTKADISNLGTILMVALIIGIIASVFNLFIGSSMLDITLDWAMLLVFFAFTAYDINKLKRLRDEAIDCDDEKLYIYGAMELYLDFINIFIRILSIMGKRRN